MSRRKVKLTMRTANGHVRTFFIAREDRSSQQLGAITNAPILSTRTVVVITPGRQHGRRDHCGAPPYGKPDQKRCAHGDMGPRRNQSNTRFQPSHGG